MEASTRYEVEADDGTVFVRFPLTEDGRDVGFVWGFEPGEARILATALMQAADSVDRSTS